MLNARFDFGIVRFSHDHPGYNTPNDTICRDCDVDGRILRRQRAVEPMESRHVPFPFASSKPSENQTTDYIRNRQVLSDH